MNEPTIMTRILRAHHEFNRTTGRAPNCLYLGYNEWAKLRLELNPATVAKDPDGGLRIYGLRTFLVTEDSHLNVAIEGE